MWEDIWFSARDGAQLYGRRYRGGAARRSLLCIPGLVGNCAEFDTLANALSLSGPASRAVFSIDCRGRARSASAGNRQGSTMLTECEDILDFMTLTGQDDVAVLGSGHGGQLAMILALLRPSAVGALILNDSGPEFEIEGVVRLLGEVTNLPLPQSWPDAAAMLKRLHSRRYVRLNAEQWMEMARAFYLEVDGRPARTVDPSIAAAYSVSKGTARRQTLWPQFAALARVPILLLRAELSDSLGEATVVRMRDIHPNLEVSRIAGEGHPALLRDTASIASIAQFLLRNERSQAVAAGALKAVA